MDTISVRLPHAEYDILLGPALLGSAPARHAMRLLVEGRRCAVVSDSNVAPLYAEALRRELCAAGAETVNDIVIAAGETSKSLATLGSLYHFGIARGLDRASVVFALGGGVVGDVAGFFAATFLRGVPYAQVPTTLLALVDSSVGGKVAVDLPEGKNLVGAFYQPRLVLGDLSSLTTLPAAELRCGLAEIVKYAVILDAGLFDLLGDKAQRVLELDLDLYEVVVARCCQLKADVVMQDERESGLRAILNYGHTFGHALETVGNLCTYSHGQAVAIGMGMAADAAAGLGLCSADLPTRQDALLTRLGLPTQVDASLDIEPETVLDHMYRDKKVRQGKLQLVLPRQIGEVAVIECTDTTLLLQSIGGRIG